MAESTELEQIKQTQILQQTEKGQAVVSGKLDKVIAVLKEEGTQEAVLTEMKEQDELLLKTVKGLQRTEDELIKVTEKIHKQGEEQQTTAEEVATETKETKDAIIEKSDEEKVLLEDAAKIASKGNDLIEAFKISQDESADQTSSFQDIMKGVEKRKADLKKQHADLIKKINEGKQAIANMEATLMGIKGAIAQVDWTLELFKEEKSK